MRAGFCSIPPPHPPHAESTLFTHTWFNLSSLVIGSVPFRYSDPAPETDPVPLICDELRKPHHVDATTQKHILREIRPRARDGEEADFELAVNLYHITIDCYSELFKSLPRHAWLRVCKPIQNRLIYYMHVFRN